MNETTNINATLECIKETTTITTRVVYNVCTGTVAEIPIGFWEFASGAVLFILFGGIILLMTIMFYVIYPST